MAIFGAMEERKKGAKKQKFHYPRLSGDAVLISSTHALAILDSEVRCVDCLQGRRSADKVGLSRWSSSACARKSEEANKLREADRRPTRVPVNFEAQVGRRKLHPSHALLLLQGVFVCSACGQTASRKAQGLARPCPGGHSRFGASVFGRLRDGERPRGAAPPVLFKDSEEASLILEAPVPVA